jgi:CDP-diacylglycerol--glycerol-3-phosphate 3-phosphatidyltransferase
VLDNSRRRLVQRANRLPAALLAKAGISPNVVTSVGLALAIGAAWVLSSGHLFLGGFLVLLAGAFDMLDGAVARLTGKTTLFGGILDSTFDRVSEGALFLGLLVYYADKGAYAEIVLVGAAMLGSMMTSYVRARAEAAGLACKVGWFTRPERVILLAIGLIANQMLVILWILAVLSNIVAFQRLVYVRQQSSMKETGTD